MSIECYAVYTQLRDFCSKSILLTCSPWAWQSLHETIALQTVCVGKLLCLLRGNMENSTLSLINLVQDCGHAPSQDDELFDQQQSPDLAVSAPQRVVLAYDERMTLHVEGQGSSHPERPDRVRAVMARLTASGITGLSHMLLRDHPFTARCLTCALQCWHSPEQARPLASDTCMQ